MNEKHDSDCRSKYTQKLSHTSLTQDEKTEATYHMGETNDKDIHSCSCVIPIIFQYLPAKDLLCAQRTCKEWQAELTPPSPAATWLYQSIVASRWPWAKVPCLTSNDDNGATYAEAINYAERMKELYIKSQYVQESLLPTVWSDNDFRQSCKYGKYSRWVLAKQFDDGAFLIDLAWAVRILYCLGPQAYLTLDGADTSAYDPAFSTCASDSPGWRLISNRNGYSAMVQQQLLLGKDSYASLEILDQVMTQGKHVHNGPRKPLIAHILEQQPEIQLTKNKNWSRAMDLEEHTKLLSFLLRHPESRRALLWDIDGVVCRGVTSLAKERYECWDTLTEACSVGEPLSRQIPHMFNMAKLGQHVEALSWDECCGF
mmetsp:Transcript_30311/g.45715  ORF Transcript_30311/g.45715 Transcript_30311/m.45715 type:complete len:371 (+) Transcript_30311:500-1612(+)